MIDLIQLQTCTNSKTAHDTVYLLTANSWKKNDPGQTNIPTGAGIAVNTIYPWPRQTSPSFSCQGLSHVIAGDVKSADKAYKPSCVTALKSQVCRQRCVKHRYVLMKTAWLSKRWQLHFCTWAPRVCGSLLFSSFLLRWPAPRLRRCVFLFLLEC